MQDFTKGHEKWSLCRSARLHGLLHKMQINIYKKTGDWLESYKNRGKVNEFFYLNLMNRLCETFNYTE